MLMRTLHVFLALALVLSVSCRSAGTLPRSPEEAVWQYVAGTWGPLSLPTLALRDQEPFADGQVVVFRVLHPLLNQRPNPTPAAILLFLQPHGRSWDMAAGGAIGTIAGMDRYAVSCAWTWLRDIVGEPTVAAFYCTVEDPRVTAIELERVDGAVQRVDATGKRAVLFPYAWEMRMKWTAQQPRAIHLLDAAGAPLALATSPVAGGESP
jgi:hypothetical protein